jgi:hypothetical protein
LVIKFIFVGHIQHVQQAADLHELAVATPCCGCDVGTGMKIIRAIVNGQHDPQVLSQMRDVRCKASVDTVTRGYQLGHVFALARTGSFMTSTKARVDEYDTKIQQVLTELILRKHLRALRCQRRDTARLSQTPSALTCVWSCTNLHSTCRRLAFG